MDDRDSKTAVEASVTALIEEHGLIQKGDLVLAGVSGGADSVCLLHILNRLSDSVQFSLEAVHVNHMLRGNESDDDEKHVSELCEDWNIPLHVERRDVKRLTKEHGISIEEAARNVRYEAFEACAGRTGARLIAVAHNRNDQAETVLLNILRGTGIDGLRGMDYKRGKIIRPLLGTGRHMVEGYCRFYGLNTRTDSSNLENQFLRNRVRNRLLPFIEELFGKDPVDSLNRLSALASKDSDYLENESEKFFKKVKLEGNGTSVRLDAALLCKIHYSIFSRILRMAFSTVSGSRKGLQKKHTDDVIKLVCSGRTGAVLHLPHGIIVEKSYNTICFFKGEQTEQLSFCISLMVPGTTAVPGTGVRFIAELMHDGISMTELDSTRADAATQFFDYNRFTGGITVRNREKGDVFMPLNAKGSGKLKDYFIDRKIPGRKRDCIPLIASGTEIAWIPGCNISDKFKVTENTKTVLKLACLGLAGGRECYEG